MPKDTTKKLTPNAIKFNITQDAISVFFAEYQKQQSTKITDEDVSQAVQLDFSPNNLSSVANAILKALIEYQKLYDIDLGISFEGKKGNGAE